MFWSAFIVLCFGLFIKDVCGTALTCPDTTWSYDATANFWSGYTLADTITTGTGFLMDTMDYHVPDICQCGLLYKWHFHAQGSGDIELQVWDREDYNIFTLKGENYINVPADLDGQDVVFYVPIKDRITVRNGYLIGWYAAGTSGIVAYQETTTSFPDEQKLSAMGDLSVGNTHDWSSGSVITKNNTKYAIGVSVLPNTAPGFTNLPRTVHIYQTWTAPALLYTVAADDINEQDVSTLNIYWTDDPTGYFNFSRTTLKVNLAKSYPPAATYTLTFTVSDQCGDTGTGVLTIVVKNWPPYHTSLPSFASLHEDTTNQVALFTITYSDQDTTVITPSVSPNTGNIILTNIGHDLQNQSIISIENAVYNYDTAQSYKMTVSLTDGTTSTGDSYFFLYITKNDPPKFTNLVNAVTAYASYITTENGDVIFEVGVTDAENDPLTFTITCDPAGCPFDINPDGVIYANADLIRLYEPGYDIVVSVTDGTTAIDSKTLTVIIQDIDYKPVITNLPLAYPLHVFEGTALDTVLYTVLYNDMDSADTHTITASYNPVWGTNYFDVNITSGIIYTAKNIIDYEELAAWTIVLTITVHDGQDSAVATLSILIGNVNEPPSFHQTRYTLEPPEEGTSGQSAGNPEFEVNDEDLLVAGLHETHYYTWDCGIYTRYFIMERASPGAIKFATTFDYDTANVTVPYDCVVTVTDKAGLSATTTLQIDIQDVNDNTPTFAQTTDYLVFQPPTLPDERFVGQVTATDIDRSTQYGTIYYSILSSPFTKSYLYINEFGNIYVNESWTEPLFDHGIMYTLVILAENIADTTGTRVTATTTVLLYLPGTSTTTTTTTDRPAGFIGDKRNVAWVTVASGIGILLLLAVFVFLMYYTIQVKRYRWCIPSCRKLLLGLQKRTLREKKRRYEELLRQEEFGSDSGESEGVTSDWEEESNLGDAPPMWNKLRIPKAATYKEPKPRLKREISGLMLSQPPRPMFWANNNNNNNTIDE